MCMIAAYIGPKNAAAQLVELTRRQQFIFGGFYSGIATLTSNRLVRKRVVGSISDLEKREDLTQLRGNIGIAHSRTDDAGGLEWSQPRFDETESLATVGVGIGGVFRAGEDTAKLANTLVSLGATYRTRSNEPLKNSITLPDGSTIHGGEAYLFGLSRSYTETKNLLASVRELGLRSESVGLYLCLDQPERIFVVNHNQRVIVAKQGEETFIVTSLLALKDTPSWMVEVPVNSYAVVTRDSVQLETLWPEETLLDLAYPPEAEQHFLDFIKKNPGSTWQEVVAGALAPILPIDRATVSQILGHHLLEKLLASGLIRYEIVSVEGRDGQSGIPQAVLFSKD